MPEWHTRLSWVRIPVGVLRLRQLLNRHEAEQVDCGSTRKRCIGKYTTSSHYTNCTLQTNAAKTKLVIIYRPKKRTEWNQMPMLLFVSKRFWRQLINSRSKVKYTYGFSVFLKKWFLLVDCHLAQEFSDVLMTPLLILLANSPIQARSQCLWE